MYFLYYISFLAQFVVHLRRPGVVAFQSLQNSLDWLAIYEGRVIGTVCSIECCHDNNMFFL